MARELLALIIAGIAAVVIVEGCERAAERRAQRRRHDHPSGGRYE